jgi:hypothetical protein
MATKKPTPKKPAKKAQTAKGGRGDSINATLSRLRRENKKLRKTIADVFGVLNEVQAEDKSDVMYGAIDMACDYIISDLPNDYHYESDAEAQAEAKNTVVALMESAQARARRAMADELNMTEAQFAAVGDINILLPVWQKILVEQVGALPADSITDEQYEARVALQFFDTFLFTAKAPTTLRAEVKRYTDVLLKIRKSLPKGKREPSKATQKMLDLIDSGTGLWNAMLAVITKENFGKDYSEMTKRERTKARRTMRKRLAALKRVRGMRAAKKDGKHISEDVL